MESLTVVVAFCIFMVVISLALNRPFREFHTQVVSPPSARKESHHGKSRWSLSRTRKQQRSRAIGDREKEA